jgi:PIN domain nuclease of toxin-antitoxin system
LNGYLLDTSTAIWLSAMPERASRAQREAVESGPTWLSVITYWEIVVKSRNGRLDISDPRRWWASSLEHLPASALAMRPRHVEALIPLPSLHRDPFDRMLLAQAVAEDLTLLSSDRVMQAYTSAGCRVIA